MFISILKERPVLLVHAIIIMVCACEVCDIVECRAYFALQRKGGG
jgi:hypothetical protein